MVVELRSREHCLNLRKYSSSDFAEATSDKRIDTDDHGLEEI
jgi:hypothetical protein